MLDTSNFTDKVARLFRARRVCRDGRRLAARKDFYETPVSAIEDSSQTSARLSQPQFDEERSRHLEKPPSRWPQAPHAGRDVIRVWARCRLGLDSHVNDASRGEGISCERAPKVAAWLWVAFS